MKAEIRVPSPGESITQVQLASWLVEEGDFVEKDQEIAEIDSDKATLTINAPESGKIGLMAKAGDTLEVNAVIAFIDTTMQGGARKKVADEARVAVKQGPVSEEKSPEIPAAGEKSPELKDAKEKEKAAKPANEIPLNISPLARKMLESEKMSEEEFVAFLKSYRFGRKDIGFFMEEKGKEPAGRVGAVRSGSRETEKKKMSTLRLKVSERLVAVKNQTAMLTTFNEMNMTPVMDIRARYKDAFKEKYGVSLGFMSFFTKAVTIALVQFPEVNAYIDGDEILYHNYADIGIAVSSPKGLMVPVLRNADSMSMAEIELKIRDLAGKARNNKITLDEMTGGTFTITNGGVFGSMLSTPILNPPQSAILGMHNIVERPVAVNGKVEIHPVMYVALSYDHRVIDGKDSVGFLVKVKEMLENPAILLSEGSDPVVTGLGL
ncbi:MAG: 2-oxoglutarate dehydrogenase complex dihydrolipoyllysine-residue succinyltransferase [Bacteroidales bacterium]|nr:2-oxoglutarate dehydrogenase complex dihydrolipoyllysine-residue succinyltransferase [Bacteroidales bacterium]